MPHVAEDICLKCGRTGHTSDECKRPFVWFVSFIERLLGRN